MVWPGPQTFVCYIPKSAICVVLISEVYCIAQCINKCPAVNTTRKSSNIRFGRKESCWPYSFKLATHEHYWGYLTQLGCQTSLTSLVLHHLAYTIYIFNVLSDASWFCNLVSPKCNLHKKVTYFYLFKVIVLPLPLLLCAAQLSVNPSLNLKITNLSPQIIDFWTNVLCSR